MNQVMAVVAKEPAASIASEGEAGESSALLQAHAAVRARHIAASAVYTRAPISSVPAAVDSPKLDLVFMVDNTGSMGGQINIVQRKLVYSFYCTICLLSVHS